LSVVKSHASFSVTSTPVSLDLLLPWVGRGNAPVDVQDVARAFA
jgi:hypothetical protein